MAPTEIITMEPLPKGIHPDGTGDATGFDLANQSQADQIELRCGIVPESGFSSAFAYARFEPPKNFRRVVSWRLTICLSRTNVPATLPWLYQIGLLKNDGIWSNEDGFQRTNYPLRNDYPNSFLVFGVPNLGVLVTEDYITKQNYYSTNNLVLTLANQPIRFGESYDQSSSVLETYPPGRYAPAIPQLGLYDYGQEPQFEDPPIIHDGNVGSLDKINDYILSDAYTFGDPLAFAVNIRPFAVGDFAYIYSTNHPTVPQRAPVLEFEMALDGELDFEVDSNPSVGESINVRSSVDESIVSAPSVDHSIELRNSVEGNEVVLPSAGYSTNVEDSVDLVATGGTSVDWNDS